MLARASTTSPSCTQSLKSFSDAQVDSKALKCSRSTVRLLWTRLGVEWPARYVGRNMVIPSPTLRCCTPPFAQWQTIVHARIFNCKTVPRVTDLCSSAHVTHKGSPWHSLERCIHRDLYKHEQTLDVRGGIFLGEHFVMFVSEPSPWWGSCLSVDRLSLQSGQDCSGKLEWFDLNCFYYWKQ